MKANELRLNNWYQSDGSLFQMTPRMLIRHLKGIENGTKNATEPIILTEEWLRRFGFKNKPTFGSSSEWQFNFFYLRQRKEDIFCTSTVVELPLEYVHQLQNLYSVIKDKELTVS